MTTLNRRRFLQSLTAAGLAPALPAIGVAAPAAPVAATHNTIHYIWASYFAQVHNESSPAMTERMLHTTPEAAKSIYAKMLRNGVINPPDLAGVSTASKPFYQKSRMLGAAQSKLGNAGRTATKLGKLDLDALTAKVTRDIDAQIPFRPSKAA